MIAILHKIMPLGNLC